MCGDLQRLIGHHDDIKHEETAYNRISRIRVSQNIQDSEIDQKSQEINVREKEPGCKQAYWGIINTRDGLKHDEIA